MPWWLDILLLGAALALWASGTDERDDVWGLFQKLLGVVTLLVVILGGRQLLLELAGLGLALWLPGTGSRRLLSLGYRSDRLDDPQDPDRDSRR